MYQELKHGAVEILQEIYQDLSNWYLDCIKLKMVIGLSAVQFGL